MDWRCRETWLDQYIVHDIYRLICDYTPQHQCCSLNLCYEFFSYTAITLSNFNVQAHSNTSHISHRPHSYVWCHTSCIVILVALYHKYYASSWYAWLIDNRRDCASLSLNLSPYVIGTSGNICLIAWRDMLVLSVISTGKTERNRFQVGNTLCQWTVLLHSSLYAFFARPNAVFHSQSWQVLTSHRCVRCLFLTCDIHDLWIEQTTHVSANWTAWE